MSPGKRTWRFLAFLLAAALFVWLGLEDNSVAPVTLFAAAWSAMFSWRFLAGREPTLLLTALTGALAGIAVTPIALALMVLKTGLHGHATPEYSPAQLASVLERTHLTMLAGLLIGLGAGAARMNA